MSLLETLIGEYQLNFLLHKLKLNQTEFYDTKNWITIFCVSFEIELAVHFTLDTNWVIHPEF